MKTNLNFKALVRLTAITVGGLSFALLMPALPSPQVNNLHVVATVIFAGTIGVLMAQASSRRRRLLDAVRIELNKLRRLYHVSKNLSVLSSEFRPWFTDLHGHIYAYMNKFAGKDFSAYDSFNHDFREISYHVYTIPPMQGAKEQTLFDDLLHTTSVIAEARQQIKELWDNRLSFNAWIMVSISTVMFAGSVVFSMPDSPEGRLVAGMALVIGFLTLDYLWKIDTLSTEAVTLPRRYVDNVGKLELGRRG